MIAHGTCKARIKALEQRIRDISIPCLFVIEKNSLLCVCNIVSVCEEAYGNHNVSKQYRGEERKKKSNLRHWKFCMWSL